MKPAMTVTMNNEAVTRGLACQTSWMTRGSAAVVPVMDCLRLRQRLRRSRGPCCSGGSSMGGSPDRPLFGGPVSGFVNRRRPHIQKLGPPSCPIMPTALPYRRLPS